MKIKRLASAVLAAALLCAYGAPAQRAKAGSGHSDRQAVPRVFWPVVAQLARSPIPVFYPTWLPRLPDKFYPAFSIFTRQYGTGPGYDLGLYTRPGVQDHAHRILEIHGIAGDEYTINTHTRPVWLGKHGWAYIDPDGTSGWVIVVVRAVGCQTPRCEYTYTLLQACPKLMGGPLKPMVACMKRVAASMRLYRPDSRGG